MTTPYSSVFNLFTMQIKDWKLDAIYGISIPDFETYLTGFLIPAIPEFEVFCDQSLERDDTTNLFTEDLTLKNMVRLASMMVLNFLNKEINDVRQIRIHVGDRDFRVGSEGLNLRAKESYFIEKREEISQSLVDYSWHGFDMSDWENGVF